MPGVCRDSDTAGGDLVPSQSTVYVNSKLVIVDGDGVVAHGAAPHIAQTLPAGLNSTVLIGLKAICVAGDAAAICGDTATGSGDVFKIGRASCRERV